MDCEEKGNLDNLRFYDSMGELGYADRHRNCHVLPDAGDQVRGCLIKIHVQKRVFSETVERS